MSIFIPLIVATLVESIETNFNSGFTGAQDTLIRRTQHIDKQIQIPTRAL